jgi:RecG-like helicase
LPAPVPGAGIGAAEVRDRVTLRGRVIACRISAVADSPSFAVELADRSGHVELLFYGRRILAGIEPGVELVASGRLAELRGRRTLANPTYTILPRGNGIPG